MEWAINPLVRSEEVLFVFSEQNNSSTPLIRMAIAINPGRTHNAVCTISMSRLSAMLYASLASAAKESASA